MKSSPQPTVVYVLYCFGLAFYLALGPYLESHFGLLGIGLGQGVVFGLLPLAYALLSSPLKKIFPFSKPSLYQLLFILLATALVTATLETILLFQEKYFSIPTEIKQFYSTLHQKASWSLWVQRLLILGVSSAFFEEFFFRGLIQSALTGRFGTYTGIFLTALLFAIAHFDLWLFLYYFIFGIFLGGCRQFRNNLTLCIVAHFLHNLYSLIEM